MKNSQDIPAKQHTLASGLRVLLVPMKGVRSVTVLAFANTGSRYETPKLGGISHFLEHMVFKGTANYPTALDLSSAVDSVGAEFNAFTGKEYTGYYVKSASRHVALSLDVLSDMLLTPRLRQEDLDREKGVIVEEINMYNDTPTRHIGDIFEQLMFEGTSLDRDIIGTKESVRGLHRDDFVNYMKKWYGAGNIVLVLAGEARTLESPSLLKQIEKVFAKKTEDGERKNGGDRNYTAKIRLGLPLPKRMKIEYKKTDQAHFILALPGLPRGHKDRYAASVLAALFGGYMSSRLFTEIREKRGLCYYVRSELDSYHEVGVFGASAGVDPARVEEAVRVVREEFLHLLDKSGDRMITDNEVLLAKEHLTGKLILAIEETDTVANMYGAKLLLEGEVETVRESLDRLGKVTVADVRRVARTLINPTEFRFTMIGPFKTGSRFEKILNG